MDAVRAASELVLNLAGGNDKPSELVPDQSSSVWLGARRVSSATLEFIFEALRVITRFAVFSRDGEAADPAFANACRE